eukprot:m.189076 g.189076  ORF g.189076 m.189076 type:complete len:79 (+) comp15098_c0_seq4:62-298(+)
MIRADKSGDKLIDAPTGDAGSLTAVPRACSEGSPGVVPSVPRSVAGGLEADQQDRDQTAIVQVRGLRRVSAHDALQAV